MEDILQKISGEQTKYLGYFNTVFRQKFGQTPNYELITEGLRDVFNKLVICEKSLTKLNVSDSGNTVIVIGYVKGLKKSVQHLYKISDKLGRKASAQEPYGWFAYRKDLKNLKLSQEEYMQYGQQMNQLFNKYS